MSLATPDKNWWQPLDKDEKMWLKVCLLVALGLFLMMPLFHLYGKQNPPTRSYRVEPAQYKELVDKFIEENAVRDEDGDIVDMEGIPVVEPKEGVKDIYLLSQKWMFTPILKLKKGVEYQLHMSSLDLNHGFSLQPKNINFQIVPGYDQVLKITPRDSGEFYIICNEYCEIGHHTMIGKLIVTE
ncbi:MAG: cytochrome C oxidase subunit II [SAR324 cluster bacterium]|uniref:Cytochrome C oxidase subunit II n=1 Tax=SAR324 cluster bacterium TaxID=2024889 RepID=A0A2A4T417_9DELT|nr:MAG: cytochrome C oxidase subunit II [SAR324 cluster bacterium]